MLQKAIFLVLLATGLLTSFTRSLQKLTLTNETRQQSMKATNGWAQEDGLLRTN